MINIGYCDIKKYFEKSLVQWVHSNEKYSEKIFADRTSGNLNLENQGIPFDCIGWQHVISLMWFSFKTNSLNWPISQNFQFSHLSIHISDFISQISYLRFLISDFISHFSYFRIRNSQAMISLIQSLDGLFVNWNRNNSYDYIII
jgi:hypothetical protein